jgi:chaperonin cofactor prefoldin
MSMMDRSKREIVEHHKTGQAQLGLAIQRIAALEAQLAESQLRATHWATKATEEAGENKPLRDQVQQLTADFDRRTDILNNHIAREKVLEARVAESGDALEGLAHEVNGLLGLNGSGLRELIGNTNFAVLEYKLNEAFSVMHKQALAAKEPKA